MRLFAALGTFLFVERFVPLVNTYERGGIPVVDPLQSVLTALPLLVLVALGVGCPPSWQRRMAGMGAALMGVSVLCLAAGELTGSPGFGSVAAAGSRCAVTLLCAGLCCAIAPFGMQTVARNLVAALRPRWATGCCRAVGLAPIAPCLLRLPSRRGLRSGG